MQDRDFKGIWIPREVWLDSRLNALEKIILMEIDSLDIDERGCFASNEYLADFCQCGVTKVSTAISKLIDLGFLESRFDGRRRFVKSRLSKNEKQTFKKCEADFQNVKAEINKNRNIKDIKEKESKEKRFAPPTVEEVRAYCQERKNGVNPDRFVDFYASKGWKVGNQSMKDWKAAVRTWEQRDRTKSGQSTDNVRGKFYAFEEHPHTEKSDADLEMALLQKNRKKRED